MIGNDVPAMTPLPGQKAASVLVATGYDAATGAEAKGNVLVETFFTARATLQEKNVTDEPSVIVSPTDYYNIVQSTRGVNADYTTGNGGIDSGKIRQVAGFSLGWTNHLDTVTNANLLALIFTKDVAGVVKAMDIKSESNYDFRRLGYQLTSYYALGMGPLNPTGMIVVNSDAV